MHIRSINVHFQLKKKDYVFLYALLFPPNTSSQNADVNIRNTSSVIYDLGQIMFDKLSPLFEIRSKPILVKGSFLRFSPSNYACKCNLKYSFPLPEKRYKFYGHKLINWRFVCSMPFLVLSCLLLVCFEKEIGFKPI